MRWIMEGYLKRDRRDRSDIRRLLAIRGIVHLFEDQQREKGNGCASVPSFGTITGFDTALILKNAILAV